MLRILLLLACATLGFAQDPDPAAEARKLAATLKDAEYEARVLVYQELSALNAGAAPPVAAVTQALVKGLLDEAFYVRQRCLPLLLRNQDPEALVKGLLKGLDQFDKDWRRIDKRIAFLGETAGTGDKGKPGFGVDDQRDIQCFMLYGSSLFKTAGRVPDSRIEKELIATLKVDLNKQPGTLFVCAANGCIALATPKAMGAVAAWASRVQVALDRSKLKPRVPRGRPWVGYSQFHAFETVSRGNWEKVVTNLREWTEEHDEGEARVAALHALDVQDWEAWLEAVEPWLAPAPGRLSARSTSSSRRCPKS